MYTQHKWLYIQFHQWNIQNWMIPLQKQVRTLLLAHLSESQQKGCVSAAFSSFLQWICRTASLCLPIKEEEGHRQTLKNSLLRFRLSADDVAYLCVCPRFMALRWVGQQGREFDMRHLLEIICTECLPSTQLDSDYIKYPLYLVSGGGELN